ncbi:MAG: hypothetical protein MI922_01115 [Bacteroidales bacterium]|nr:hypothetical protein [Bacteroidales bacterium]
MKSKTRIQNKLWGEMISFDDPSGSEFEWLPSNNNQRELELYIVGNESGPLVENENTIHQILKQGDQIFGAIKLHLSVNKDQYLFLPHIKFLDLESLHFFDSQRSDRFYGNCVAEFPEDAKHFPKAGCAGNGFWEMKFLFEAMKIVKLVGE